MSQPAPKLQSRHWPGKSAAGLLLGFGLALAASGLYAWWGPGGIDGGPGKLQFNMWLMAPVWAVVLGFVFLFRTPLRAWLWLSFANLLAFGLLYASRGLLG